MRIMVLDNQRIHVESLVRGLITKGHDVLSASDGKKALDHLRREDSFIDLIITDHSMILRDGVDLVNHLEKSGRRPPVIMMTATAEQDRAINPLYRVCGLFLEKPFSIDDLSRAIERCARAVTPPTEVQNGVVPF
jgi:DNA-binding NtrC family response regulator